MQTKSIIITVCALIVGIFIGYAVASNGNREIANYNNGGHMMPDGTTMGGSNMSMTEMMSHMNAQLKGKKGDAFDKAFLSEMIVHHEGAVEMAKIALQNAGHQEIKNLATAIISAQTSEIAQMNGWLKTWFSVSDGAGNGNSGGGDEAVFCTMDAKMCPDGSYVGRTGPKCEFAACPGN